MENEIKDNLVINYLRNNLKLIISLIAIFITAISIFFFISKLNYDKSIKISEDYNSAKLLIKKGKKTEGFNILNNIIDKKNKLYSPLSLFFIIENNLENDEAKIIQQFDKIITIRSIKKEDKNLLRIKKALFLSSGKNEKDFLETINTVINSKSIWRNDAINIAVNYYLYKGEKIKAEEYNKLLDKN